MRVSPLRVVVSLVLWLMLMCSLTVFYWWNWLQADHFIPKEHRQFVIERGESIQSVAQRLYRAHIIRWPNVWRYYARFIDPAPIKAGEYRLSRHESPRSILDKLQEGKVITYDVTLIEGTNFQEVLTRLASHTKLASLLLGRPLAEQLDLLGLDIAHPEGWFYPDTYRFIAGDTDVSILRRAHAKMHALLMAEWPQRDEGLPYETPYEALIMASIIEKETGVEGERPAIAGVFVRRLQRGMRLQTDPTVIYGLGLQFDGNLTRAHLRQDTPYNTYTRAGLPPTPIAMPGAKAIRAALHPLAGDALYFVAKGDGSHYFSATLEEHNEAVRRHQRFQRAENYRSSPAPVNVNDKGGR